MGSERPDWHKMAKFAGWTALGTGVIYEGIKIVPPIVAEAGVIIRAIDNAIPNCCPCSTVVFVALVGRWALGRLGPKSDLPSVSLDMTNTSGGHDEENRRVADVIDDEPGKES